jgi:hypothetical protein
MSEHVRNIPADSKDREKFAREWREDRDFKESEKSKRFKKIREKRKNQPGGYGNINIAVNGDDGGV